MFKPIRSWPLKVEKVLDTRRTLEGNATGIAVSSDGRCIVTSHLDKTLRKWDFESGKCVGRTTEQHLNTATAVAMGVDGKSLVSGGGGHQSGREVQMWALGEPSEAPSAVGEHIKGHKDVITAVTVSSDGRYIVTGSEDKTVRRWDFLQGGKPVGNPLEHKDAVMAVACSPDMQYIVSGCRSSQDDDKRTQSHKDDDKRTQSHKVHVWCFDRFDRTTTTNTHILKGHERPVTSVAVSPDSAEIVSCDELSIRVWCWERSTSHADTFRQHYSIEGDNFIAVAVTPDGCHIICLGRKPLLRCWALRTAQPVGSVLKRDEVQKWKNFEEYQMLNGLAVTGDLQKYYKWYGGALAVTGDGRYVAYTTGDLIGCCEFVPMEEQPAATEKEEAEKEEVEEQEPEKEEPQAAASSSASSERLDDRPPPQDWGMYLHELVAFRDAIAEDLVSYTKGHRLDVVELEAGGRVFQHVCLEDPCPCSDHQGTNTIKFAEVEPSCKFRPLPANMHLVVSRHIKPATAGTGRSFALQERPQGLRANVFVTHCWDEDFLEFSGTLEAALDPSDVVWICSFALYQHGDIHGMLHDDLRRSPFALALETASLHLVCVDSGLQVPTRAWCIYEIRLSIELGKPIFFWFHNTSIFEEDVAKYEELLQAVESVDLREARASVPEDLRRIMQDVEHFCGVQALNHRVKANLVDRARFCKHLLEKPNKVILELRDLLAARSAELNLSREDAAKMASELKTLRAEVRTLHERADVEASINEGARKIEDMKRQMAHATGALKDALKAQQRLLENEAHLQRRLRVVQNRLADEMTAVASLKRELSEVAPAVVVDPLGVLPAGSGAQCGSRPGSRPASGKKTQIRLALKCQQVVEVVTQDEFKIFQPPADPLRKALTAFLRSHSVKADTPVAFAIDGRRMDPEMSLEDLGASAGAEIDCLISELVEAEEAGADAAERGSLSGM